MKKVVFLVFGAIAALVICVSVVLISSPDAEPSSSVDPQVSEASVYEAEASSTDTPQPTPTLIPLAPPFEKIESAVKSMTEAQWKAFLPTLDGMLIENWIGWVTDVDVLSGDRYELWVSVGPPELFSSTNVYIPIPEEIALEIQKGQKVTFSGIIDHVSEFIGSVSVHLEDGAIVEW